MDSNIQSRKPSQSQIGNSSKTIKIRPSNPSVYTWGFSKYAQTGIKNCHYCIEPFPLKFPSSQEIIYINAGESNTAFITKDGSSYIFGENTFGQLCDESKNLSYIPKIIPIKCSKISIGGGHVLALTKENILYTWGLNIFGQLGLGHTNNVVSPAMIEKVGFMSNDQEQGSNIVKEIPLLSANEIIIDLAAGAQHSMILTNKNNLYSCGFAKNKALGYFNTNNELEPNESSVFIKINTNHGTKKINNISCGVNHSGCVLGNYEILLWGKSEYFEFEGIKRFNLLNAMNKPDADAITISDSVDTENNDNSGKGSSNLNILKDLKIGENFVVLLSSNGEMFCSGSNQFGQLGIGTKDRTKLFEKVLLNDKVKIRQISAGYQFIYAIDYNGKVYGWGSNKYGQLLDLTSDKILSPKEIQQLNEMNISLISCGGYHVACLSIMDKKQYENKMINYKKIPLNKGFDLDVYQKELEVINNIHDLTNKQITFENSLKQKEGYVLKLSKTIEEKTKKELLQKIKKKNETKNQSNHLTIEKLLDEEIKYNELRFPENDFLGGGAFGEVRKAYWRETLVAVKFLKANLENQEDQVIPFIEEFNLLKKLRHPSILLFIGGCISGPRHFMVTEYCENGNLFELLHGAKPIKLNDKERIDLALKIAKGVNYLHSFNPPILHRDLKSLNILVNKYYDIKIADFGWARLRNNQMTRLRGTFQWMAPEVILKENYTEKADVYSFGIILWELWSIDPPYKDVIAKDVGNNVKKDKNYRPKISQDVPLEIAELMKRCWDYEPSKRPSFREIIYYLEKFL